MNPSDNLTELLSTLFEPELVQEMIEYPLMKVPANVVAGKRGDKLDSFSLILNGSVRAIRYDDAGEEILIYNMYAMESCIISITSALQDRETSSVFAITNEETTLLNFPGQKAGEWMDKYPTWRKFAVQLYESRLFELLQNHETVKEQQTSIVESIRYAQRIQNAVLPPPDLVSSLLPEHFILYKPRDIVSGDYYWMTQAGNKTFVVVADCTGHGVPGAFMSMLGVTLLNQNVKTGESLHANEILDGLRENIIRSLRQDSSLPATKDGMDMSLLIIDKDKNELEYAGANSPLYVIRDNELIVLEADRMPVGIHPGRSTKFSRKDLTIKGGDRFYAFSDGYVDQFGGERNKKFLRKNFSELLLKIHQLPMKEQKVVLEKTVEEWRGEHEQVDDILVLGFKI